MKFTLIILLAGLFLVSPAKALTVMQKVDSTRNCPESLHVQISALKGKPDLFIVELLFLPEPADTHSLRVFNKLMVMKGDELIADVPLDVILDGQQFRSQFRIHRSALEQSKVTVSMYVVERAGGGMPVLGGGQVYEISLKGFIEPPDGDDLLPGVAVPLIENLTNPPAKGQ